MANYKKFIYVSKEPGTIEGVRYDTEADKFGYVLSQASQATDKWYKSIIFREATYEIYNRGTAYGLNPAWQGRIVSLEDARAALDASKSIDYVPAVLWAAGDVIPEGKKVGDIREAASYEVDLTSILSGDGKSVDVVSGVASINVGVGIRYKQAIAPIRYTSESEATEAGKSVGDIKTEGTPATIGLYDKNGNLLGETVAVSSLIGNGLLKETSYSKNTGLLSLTFAQAAGEDTVIDIDLRALLDINDMSIAEDSKIYMSVTLESNPGADNEDTASQAVFGIKIKKMSEVAKATVWTSEEADEYNTTHASDPDYTPVQAGQIKTKAITGVADALDVKTFIEDTIDSLDHQETEVTGTNVHVTYHETDGITEVDQVKEDYALITRIPHEETIISQASYDLLTVAQQKEYTIVVGDDGVRTYAKVIKPAALVLTKTDQTRPASGLVIGTDIENLKIYTDEKISEESVKINNRIQELEDEVLDWTEL